jgi:acyl-CoA synthetase (NDP forming)
VIERHRKPIIAVSLARPGLKYEEISPIVTYPTPERAVRVLARMHQYHQLQQRKS